MNPYLLLGVAVAWSLSLAAAGWKGYDYGQLTERDKTSAATLKYQQAEARRILQLEELKKERDRDTQNALRIIRNAKGPCLDQRIEPADLLKRLRH